MDIFIEVFCVTLGRQKNLRIRSNASERTVYGRVGHEETWGKMPLVLPTLHAFAVYLVSAYNAATYSASSVQEHIVPILSKSI